MFSTTGTRYDSLAQAPRSIILQRSEQKGRYGLALSQATVFPHCGQFTMRGLRCIVRYSVQNVSSNSTSVSAALGRCTPSWVVKRMFSAYLFALISGTQ